MPNKRTAYIANAMKLKIIDDKTDKKKQGIAKGESYGILVDVPIASNMIQKLLAFLLTVIKVKQLKRQVQKESNVKGCYGIYPTIEDPLILYPLQTTAEHYANQHILPNLNGGINGLIRRMLMKTTKCHPSIAGIVMVVEAK